jgi:germacradienol/geosmin synthase
MQLFALPDFYMPYPARLNSHLEPAREHARAWACDMGMLDSLPDVPGFGIWDEAEFDSADFALFAALTHPDASGPELDLAVDWHVCWWFFDDLFVEIYKHRRDLVGARMFVDRLKAFMPLDFTVIPVPTNPVERGLADLWPRTAPSMSVDFRRQFAGGAMELARAALWELANLVQNRLPDLVDYIEMRRMTGGADHSMNVARYTLGAEISCDILRAQPMRTLFNTFADVVPLRNDIFSYQKEIDLEAENSNSVVVVRRFLDCDLQQAVNVVNELTTARLRQFEQTVAEELPPLFEEFDLGPRTRSNIQHYVKAMQDWMAGDLTWSLTTGRYQAAHVRPLPTETRLPAILRHGGPTGLGTSAGHITPSRGSGARAPVFS